MMILDGHIHVREMGGDAAAFVEQMNDAGIDGGAVVSYSPPSFRGAEGDDSEARLDDVLRWTDGHDLLFPLFWIDPLEAGASGQVAAAVERGVAGFKVIPSRHEPGDERAMPVYRQIAAAGKPILFHSGILWDGRPSGNFCRPCNYEALLEVDGLRFAVAHISWPWIDECIAVYGKFLNARSNRPDLSVEMFIDLTPGTPPIYRRDALTKLFTVGYDVAHNVIFGLDCCTNDYNVSWATQWIERDNAIYDERDLPDDVREQVFGANLRRFVGAGEVEVDHRPLRPAE
ncbi:MAG: amidohydrolase family protein [Planctomycetota bacterium]